MKFLVYNLLFALVYPLLVPGFLLRMCRRGGYAARMADRFALYPADLPHPQSPVWIHAVSVGEVQVAGQLMREWRRREPSVAFVFSTTSSTGWKMAERELGERDVLIYNPLDFPNFVKSALKTFAPRALILTESEIWPNLLHFAAKYRIPSFLINARISDRSAPRYARGRWFFGEAFRSFARIFAQSKLDAERLLAAGALAQQVVVSGSFKFDVARRNAAKEAEIAAWLGKGGKILLGGSTWPGEEELLLECYRELRARVPGLRLVLAPRHAERAEAVERRIHEAGFGCIRRSRGETGGEAGAVFLADTTGELMGLYANADVVFVGKSICAKGAQNMIEPCLCGKPTIVGPHTENFRPVMSDLLEHRAITQVADASALAKVLALALDGGLDEQGARAAQAVAERCGVVSECVGAIIGMLAK